MEHVIVVLISFVALFVGYIFGVLHERTDWNKLIEEGKITKPSKHNRGIE